ncbi:MAG: hypothetical protein ABIQ95_15685 [Bdellovibrionia bacterium]
MTKLALFTQRRLTKFVLEFRKQTGQLPTLKDFESAGFDRSLVELGVREEILEQFYTTLTNGNIVKTYKVRT